MDLNLEGKTGLVTGASAGIGRAIALSLAKEGVRLALVARRQALLEEVAREIAAAKAPAPILVVADLMDEDAAERIGEKALEALGRVDILVNSAGASRPLPIDAGEDLWNEAITLNFTRLRQVTQRVIPGMIGNKWGRIINISGKNEPWELNGSLTAKAALHAWAKSISRELGRSGITVNSIAPGRIVSEQILRNYTDEQRLAATKEIPVGEYGDPQDLANLAIFLASPRARYITGTVIPVDGGLRRYAF